MANKRKRPATGGPKAPRSNKRIERLRHEAKRAKFLAAYAELGSITAAAKKLGMDRSAHYQWLDDSAYMIDFAKANRLAVEGLEAEARRRAVDGFEVPVFQGGKKIGTQRTYSDRLLEKLLEANAPEKYREKLPYDDETINLLIASELARIAGRRKDESIDPPAQGAKPAGR